VIFVTLGTHPQPMTRLVDRVELLAGRQGWEEVIVQTPAPIGHRDGIVVTSVLAHDEFLATVDRAEVVIAHAGPGTLAAIRAAGKVAVVVPRSPPFGEHVDDHQELYARRLVGKPGYLVVADLDQLEWAVEQARSMGVPDVTPNIGPALQLLEKLLHER
jgi:UDP-N-acetylglucosamine transferase subunit ALG13